MCGKIQITHSKSTNFIQLFILTTLTGMFNLFYILRNHHHQIKIQLRFQIEQLDVFNTLPILAVVIALGWLVIWHSKLIKRSETSIEAHTNRTEAKRMALAGLKYQNPYDFGTKRNLEVFFGLVDGRTFWRHFLLPSTHRALGDGLFFEMNRTVI